LFATSALSANDFYFCVNSRGIVCSKLNNQTLVIKEFLSLDSWDLEKCRKLVIKMRDSLYPTIETAEKQTTSAEIIRLIQTVRELAKNK